MGEKALRLIKYKNIVEVYMVVNLLKWVIIGNIFKQMNISGRLSWTDVLTWRTTVLGTICIEELRENRAL